MQKTKLRGVCALWLLAELSHGFWEHKKTLVKSAIFWVINPEYFWSAKFNRHSYHIHLHQPCHTLLWGQDQDKIMPKTQSKSTQDISKILPRPCSGSSYGRGLRWRGLLISKQTTGKHFQRRNSGKKWIKYVPKSRACFQQNFLWKKWEGFQIRKSQYKCGELIWLSWDEAWESKWKSAEASLEY